MGPRQAGVCGPLSRVWVADQVIPGREQSPAEGKARAAPSAVSGFRPAEPRGTGAFEAGEHNPAQVSECRGPVLSHNAGRRSAQGPGLSQGAARAVPTRPLARLTSEENIDLTDIKPWAVEAGKQAGSEKLLPCQGPKPSPSVSLRKKPFDQRCHLIPSPNPSLTGFNVYDVSTSLT